MKASLSSGFSSCQKQIFLILSLLLSLANIGEYWFWRRLQRSGARDAESPLRNKLSNIRGNYSPQPLSQNWRECCPQKIKDGQSSLCLHSSSLKSLSILKTKQSNASIPAPSSFLIFPLHGDKQIKRAHGLQINPFRTSHPAVWPQKKHGTIWLLRSSNKSDHTSLALKRN